MDEIKVGDRVTGKDRSYRRSIYEVTNITTEGLASLKLVCFDGALGGVGRHTDFYKDRPLSKFRLATKKELHEELSLAYKLHLLDMTKRLLKVKRFYPEQL